MVHDSKKQSDQVLDLHAKLRRGKVAASKRGGYVPGVVYGEGQAPTEINLNYNVLLKRLKAGRFLQTLFNLKVEGGEEMRVVCRAVQRDHVENLPTHVDFMRLHDESRISLFIHVNFVNHDASPGLTAGGSLTIVRPEVELEVMAGSIPDQITVDLTGKLIGDVIHIGDIKLPDEAKPTIQRNFVIATISEAPTLTSVASGKISKVGIPKPDAQIVEMDQRSASQREPSVDENQQDPLSDLVKMNDEVDEALRRSSLLLRRMQFRIRSNHFDEE